MEKDDSTKVLKILKNRGASKEFVETLKGIFDSQRSISKQYNCTGHASKAQWSDEDFITALKEQGVEVNEYNLSYLKDSVCSMLANGSLTREILNALADEMRRGEGF